MPPEFTDDETPEPGRRLTAGSPPRRRNPRQPLLLDDPPAEPPGVHRLHTAAMMADVLGVPPAAIRHWSRGGLLVPAHVAGSVEWFDFPQLVVGRHLARLLAGGLSLREIDAKLGGLAPGGARAAAEAAARVRLDGRRLNLDEGGRLLAPGRQLQLGFYTSSFADAADAVDESDEPAIVGMRPTPPAAAQVPAAPAADLPAPGTDAAEILDLADDLEAAGEFVEAAEALRAVLQAQGPSARVVFMLAELLYRSGDLTAARERYYAVIEIDPDHLQARASLGCVLAELGEHDLAVAALEGVLRQEPDYADAHWHIAGVLREMGHASDADHHLRRFLALAPASPWATLARVRLDEQR
ncbi:MAG: tetratricopeptide repeat protein [Planctomycetes bacterium]|nr:tetratricopeptide repeat protein [Planctomycetota bacterium]